MENSSENEELQEFLRKVDELESVVKGDLNVTGDVSEQVRLENKNPVNRTVINTNAFKDDQAPSQPAHQIPASTAPMSASQDGFMKAVERDAAERAERRKEAKKRATEWKDKGNVEFKEGNYEKAIEHYTEGLAHLKDFGVLYTNRSQAYNKVGCYEEAIADCDLILRLEPKNSKAHIHRGKALLGQLKYEEAIDSYKEILQYDPKQQKMVDKYILEAKQAMVAAESEEAAKRTLEGGDMHSKTMTDVLSKLWRPNQNLMYYAGGMRVLKEMIQDDTARTLFRTGKGFDLLTEAHIQRCLSKVIDGKKKAEAVEVTHSLLDLMSQVVIQNDENSRAVVESKDFASTFLGLLGSGNPDISRQCVALLLRLTENSVSRQRIITTFDNASLLVGLLAYVQTSQNGSVEAAKVLNNLALENKFSVQFRNKVDDQVLPAFEKFLTHSITSQKSDVFPSCISFMGNMAHDPVIRKQIAGRKEFWEASINVLKYHTKHLNKPSSREMVYTTLGLLMNITMETSQTFKDQSEGLCNELLPLVKSDQIDIQERAAGLLGRALPHSTGAAQAACEARIPAILHQTLQNSDLSIESKSALSRCLVVFTQISEEARNQIAQADPDLSCFLSLLSSTSDTVVANIALSIGHCIQVEGVSERLADTDVVKTLLAKTDTTNETIKQNCSITLAKLATSHQRHLERLRDLGGIGILHTCSKYALR
nr:tetratricopeptide repeat protein 12-like [Lytechinus pictus]